MSLEIDREARARLVEALQRYFREKLDDEIGNLDAEFLIGFFERELGAAAYNQGVRDAQAWIAARVVEVDGACFEDERGYWAASSR